jgi:hypothetical protein
VPIDHRLAHEGRLTAAAIHALCWAQQEVDVDGQQAQA